MPLLDTQTINEVAFDETDSPQTPAELFLILARIAAEGVPVQTIAPKFTGRFNKGVDYVGALAQFEKEFGEDLDIVAFTVREFGLPDTLKLSVHSGSDKFSIYPVINRLVKLHDSGLHIKSIGSSWLEELSGFAEAGGEVLSLASTARAEMVPAERWPIGTNVSWTQRCVWASPRRPFLEARSVDWSGVTGDFSCATNR